MGDSHGVRTGHAARAPERRTAAPRPLRPALAIAGPARPDAVVTGLDLAEHADALDFDSLWLPENHFRPGATASPLLTLAAVAARTRKLRLATTSILIPIHDPWRVAAEVATLDQLSGGRAIFGVGRGFDRLLFQTFGVDPKEKRDRFEWALDAILAAWTGGAPGFPPDLPLPVQRPHPPVVVAAFGPKGLRQAARRGLPYLASPLERLDVLIENYRRHREDLPEGTDAGALEVPVMRTAHVAGSRAEAERARRSAAAEFSDVAERVGKTLAAKASGDVDERVVVGEVDEVVERLETYREAIGMDLLVIRPAPGTDHREQRASLERLATRVLPQLSRSPSPA